MTRRAALLAAVLLTGGLLTGGAGPSPYPPYAFVEPLPLPRATSPWSGYTPAPMPNSDIDGPANRRSEPSRSQLTPRLYLPHASYQGDGYTPNSTVQGEQQRRFHPAPAFNLSVPLQ